jgi:pre-rRNA-processing protein IPI3
LGNIGIQGYCSLVDNQQPFELPASYCSFTAHTLTITDIIVGLGPFPLCRIMSSSLDSSVKVGDQAKFPRRKLLNWLQVWDLKSKSILSTFAFPSPITTIAWDRTERVFFAASPKGSVHRVNLFRKRQDRMQVFAMEALGGGAANGEHVQISTLDGETTRLISIGCVNYQLPHLSKT